jgi:hypothetical protein
MCPIYNSNLKRKQQRKKRAGMGVDGGTKRKSNDEELN